MTNVLYLIGWNCLVAALMGIAVWLSCRAGVLRRRPALCHGLWLLVLFKLVTPPLVPVPMLPAIAAVERGEIATIPKSVEHIGNQNNSFGPFGDDANASKTKLTETVVEPSEAPTVVNSTPRVAIPRESYRFAWRETCVALLGASLVVSISLWVAAMRQFRQVRRLLRGSSVQAGRAAELLCEVSRRFGSRSTPGLSIVNGSITPMLWAGSGKATIVLPRQMADSFDDDQLQRIIAHELGHFVRRDHWSNLFAFMVTTLFWWNPVAWFARRELASAAETCCDALAVARLSGSRKSYAKTLLAAVDFVTLNKPLQPVLGIAFGESRSLRRRFEMLASANVRSDVSRTGWILLALGSATLMLLPARAQEKPAPSTSPTAVAGATVSADDSDASASPVKSEPNEPNQNPKFYVTGVVSEKQTRKPIADAEVNILVDNEQNPDKRLLSGATDSEGRYRIEVPLGSVRLWSPRLKPGYWLDPADAMAALVTSPDKPTVTHDIAANSGIAWPVRVAVEGGIPVGTEFMVSVMELEDDATRQSWIKGAGVSLNKHPNSSFCTLGTNGIGAFTQCGETGKLIVNLGSVAIGSVMSEFIVKPGFDINKVKSIAPVAGTDKVTMTDEAGATATIGKAEVTLENGLPLLTFHLARRLPSEVQAFAGQVVDAAGNPVEAVRVGAALATPSGGSGDTAEFATTDKDGRFALKLTMPESKEKHHLMLVITKDGYAGFDSPKIAMPKEATPVVEVGKFVLQTGQSLPIRVVDANDKPLAGAVVEPQHDYALRRQAIRTDAQGRGILRNLPASVVSLYASYGSLMLQSKIVVYDQAAENEEITLRLRPFDPAQAKPVPDPPPLGTAAPNWLIVGWTDGQTRTLDDYRGKVIVLDFWGIWCSACMNGLPATKEIEAKYAGRADIVFLGIHSAGTDMSQIKKLQRLKDWNLVTGLDEGSDLAQGAMARAYGAQGWPATVIIDREGKIAYNSNLEKWDKVTIVQEKARVAKALNLPAEKSEASFEEQVARINAINVFRLSELIDRALEQK